MKIFFLCLILFLSTLLGSFTTIPVVLGVLLVWYIFSSKGRWAFGPGWIFFAAFTTGLLLDFMLMREAGITSLIFVSFLFLVNLYEKKFEIKTANFILLFSFFGSLVYLEIYRQNYILQQSIINSLIAVLLFKTFNRIERKKIAL
ncbi:MAG: DUF687 domain-containing protein [Patescibacteria group bacterium]|nr:DUF687 domain-containing protein [Patescibacteria group bacterium]